MLYNKKIISLWTAVLIVATASFFIGVSVGYENRPSAQKITSVFNKDTPEQINVDFAPFWTTWNLLNEKYVSINGVSEQEKIYGAITGLVGSIQDPYTVFFPPEEARMFEGDIRGEFQGVGMEIGIRDGNLTVIAPLKNTPAFNAGIRSGDIIISIDGEMTSGMNVEEAVRLIRGEKGVGVALTILRAGEADPITINIIRDTITIPTIDTEVRTSGGDIVSDDGNLPYGTPMDQGETYIIRLYNFSAQSPGLFRDALRQFVLSGKDKLILDLRGNPGGYLESAVDMASWFLPAGKVVVREEFARDQENRIYRSKGYNIFNDNLKMAILVDGGSASASEILAGALSEHKIATLVGTKTFGKGSIQELVPVTDDTSLKITVARWVTPNGISISQNGLMPDVTVEISKEDINAGRDPQLRKAIELLSR